jgi:hypothetical protein
MDMMAFESSPRFILALGDNFYEFRLQAGTEALRFQHTHEDVNNATSLSHMPWFETAGNHDHMG